MFYSCVFRYLKFIKSKFRTMEQWKKARSPNYATNENKLYPYSELPFSKEYKLVKIPFCLKNLIEHVDYFGEGRIELDTGISGFSNCYNVNDQYSLVSDGPDKGRKIPNRIPYEPGYDCSTRNYIKDNSVLTVTVPIDNYPISKNRAQDITRIVNSDCGKVIIYGCDEENLTELSEELEIAKQLFYCPIYTLPNNLQLSYYKTYRAYLNINEFKRKLSRNINKGNFEAAVTLTVCLSNPYCGGALGDVVNKLLENNIGNVIIFAYKLWKNDKTVVVRQHFPSVFQQLFDGNCMAIINKKNNQALVLEPKTTQAQGDSRYKIIPIWDDDNVLFKLYNIDSKMYLQLRPTVEEKGDGQACDSKDSKYLGDKFYFDPLIVLNGQVAFNIYNCEDDKKSELPVDGDSSAAVVETALTTEESHKGDSSTKDERSSWVLTPSSQVKSSVKDTLDVNEDCSNIYDFD